MRCRRRQRALAALGVTGLLTLAGCGAPGPSGGQVTGAGVPAPAHSPYTPLGLGPAERRAARRTGHAALRAYTRPRRTPARWWQGVRPYLSADARLAYAGTDPVTIAARAVIGPARLTPASLPALARVAVPTDTGLYLVLLSRSPGRPWSVERLIAPEVVG